jgi:hypothetical protein
MTATTATTELPPPRGYPTPGWDDDPDGAFYVPPTLREDYTAAAARGVGGTEAYADLTLKVRPDYEPWAHLERLHGARQRVRVARRAAAADARLVTCPGCGDRVAMLGAAGAGVPGGPTVNVCVRCRPLMVNALTAHAPARDGRTRGQSLDDLAAEAWATHGTDRAETFDVDLDDDGGAQAATVAGGGSRA